MSLASSTRSRQSGRAAASIRSGARAAQPAAHTLPDAIGEIISGRHSASKASCSSDARLSNASTRSQEKKRDEKSTAKLQSAVSKTLRSQPQQQHSHNSAQVPPSKAHSHNAASSGQHRSGDKIASSSKLVVASHLMPTIQERPMEDDELIPVRQSE